MPRFIVVLTFGDKKVIMHVTANNPRAAVECATLVAVETNPRLPRLSAARVDMETIFLEGAEGPAGGPDDAA